MKIQYCSDLHLELKQNQFFIRKHPLDVKGDILILAGDIVSFEKIDEVNDFFDFVSSSFCFVYWIPGNHEYYGCDINSKANSFCEKIRENVFLVNNYSIELKEVKIICSTLWSEISDFSSKAIEKTLFDFKYIDNGDRKLNVQDFNLLHKNALNFLNSELSTEIAKKKIVVTHYVPTFYNYPEKFRENPYREGFATELRDLIIRSQVDYWIYGHHHSNVLDFKLNITKLITNQLGYVGHKKNASFRKDAFFEI